MKLLIDYAPRDCGKSRFLKRLCMALEGEGVRCVFGDTNADVALLISRLRGPLPRCPRVIRMDGIDLLDTPRNRRKLWHEILPSMKVCGAVVFQSNYCQSIINAFLPHEIPPGRQYVIHNGANPAEFAVAPTASPLARNVLLGAQWFKGEERTYKRLDLLMEFIRDYTRDDQDTMFWIAGRTNPAKVYRNGPRTRFLGELSGATLARYLRMADVYLHMPEFSWCDNSLVEAICAGCYPVGSNVGGNAEVIRAVGGWIVNCDSPREPGFLSEYVPGPIDWAGTRRALAGARLAPPVSCLPVHIANVARRYREVFQALLGESPAH